MINNVSFRYGIFSWKNAVLMMTQNTTFHEFGSGIILPSCRVLHAFQACLSTLEFTFSATHKLLFLQLFVDSFDAHKSDSYVYRKAHKSATSKEAKKVLPT
jgi:hypothetical protein